MAQSLSPSAPASLDEAVVKYQRTHDRSTAETIAELLEPLADFHARRFQRVGAAREDLRQTALLAMFRSVDRFDAGRGVKFTTFASRTAEGELKRFQRDRTWGVRPPRAVQETYLALRGAEEHLLQVLGRTPEVSDLAAQVGVSLADALEALEAAERCRPLSVEATVQGGAREDPSAWSGPDPLNVPEPGYDRFEDLELLGLLLDELGFRDREILRLRFVEEWTQKEIADAMGLSQSYLSRVIRRALDQLHVRLGTMVRDRPLSA
jgi:RNA polymerase sigma-B factor